MTVRKNIPYDFRSELNVPFQVRGPLWYSSLNDYHPYCTLLEKHRFRGNTLSVMYGSKRVERIV
jgi:hypothetical protein